MKISTRVSGSYIILSILVLACGSAGLYGVTQLSKSLEFITNEAWNTADGAMEGTIGIESQMLAISEIIDRDVSLEEGQRMLNDAKEMADEALGRMAAAGLISSAELSELEKARSEFREVSKNVVSSFGVFNQADQQLDEDFFAFQKLMEDVEEMGDGAVEELENNPDLRTSWNSGLQEKWSAADGAMETQIGLLQRIYYYERLTSGADQRTTETQLQDALAFFSESVEEIIEHPMFRRLRPSGSSKTYSDLLREHKNIHVRDFDNAIAAFKEFDRDHHHYNEVAETLLEIIERVEESGDGAVENEQQAIEDTISSSQFMVIFSVVVSLAVAIIGGLWIVRGIVGPLKTTVGAMTDISRGEGDLTKRLTSTGDDELGDLSEAFNEFAQRMQDVISSVKEATDTIENGAKEISTGNMDLSQRTQEQASSLEEVASNIEELTSTVQQNADSAKKAYELASHNKDQAENGIQVISETSAAMQEVNAASDEIVDIISTIESIAFQTNLLALNAAVEAARAGDEGRGFAVVASEVRTLAQRTSDSANNIKNLIENTVTKVRHSAELAEQSGKVFERITEDVEQMLNQVSEINHASQEQSSGILQINQAISLLEQMTQQNSALVEEAAAASGLMSDESQKLADLMSYFKVGTEGRKLSRSGGQSTVQQMIADRMAREHSGPAIAPTRSKAPQVTNPKPPAARTSTPETSKGDDEWTEF
ncbi:MAG: methyl-accepting chemotaxis protein [Gammaproteobacteria bacterium]|nr:methyl-accepting chemotaxis protein [Gammaproteobacteria bacterium]